MGKKIGLAFIALFLLSLVVNYQNCGKNKSQPPVKKEEKGDAPQVTAPNVSDKEAPTLLRLSFYHNQALLVDSMMAEEDSGTLSCLVAGDSCRDKSQPVDARILAAEEEFQRLQSIQRSEKFVTSKNGLATFGSRYPASYVEDVQDQQQQVNQELLQIGTDVLSMPSGTDEEKAAKADALKCYKEAGTRIGESIIDNVQGGDGEFGGIADSLRALGAVDQIGGSQMSETAMGVFTGDKRVHLEAETGLYDGTVRVKTDLTYDPSVPPPVAVSGSLKIELPRQDRQSTATAVALSTTDVEGEQDLSEVPKPGSPTGSTSLAASGNWQPEDEHALGIEVRLNEGISPEMMELFTEEYKLKQDGRTEEAAVVRGKMEQLAEREQAAEAAEYERNRPQIEAERSRMEAERWDRYQSYLREKEAKETADFKAGKYDQAIRDAAGDIIDDIYSGISEEAPASEKPASRVSTETRVQSDSYTYAYPLPNTSPKPVPGYIPPPSPSPKPVINLVRADSSSHQLVKNPGRLTEEVILPENPEEIAKAQKAAKRELAQTLADIHLQRDKLLKMRLASTAADHYELKLEEQVLKVLKHQRDQLEWELYQYESHLPHFNLTKENKGNLVKPLANRLCENISAYLISRNVIIFKLPKDRKCFLAEQVLTQIEDSPILFSAYETSQSSFNHSFEELGKVKEANGDIWSIRKLQLNGKQIPTGLTLISDFSTVTKYQPQLFLQRLLESIKGKSMVYAKQVAKEQCEFSDSKDLKNNSCDLYSKLIMWNKVYQSIYDRADKYVKERMYPSPEAQ